MRKTMKNRHPVVLGLAGLALMSLLLAGCRGTPTSSLTLEASVDADGDALDASMHDYVVHFAAEELPPVKSVWSLSMYNLPQQHFIQNSIDRYLLGDNTKGFVYGEDDSRKEEQC